MNAVMIFVIRVARFVAAVRYLSGQTANPRRGSRRVTR